MNPARWQEIKIIFEGAVELSLSEQRLFLENACSGDPQLREEVESLLGAHRGAGNFIEEPVKVDGDILRDQRSDPLLGTQLGPYLVVREIARGGMGAVYEAVRVDAEYEKLVAVKVVHAGMDTVSVLNRFRNERQILANLDHPNIARLLDGGTMSDGRPYFVMEFVAGTPIDMYCEQKALALNDRLRLFQTVAKAVHYAHQRLVIHRDIKPTNVLVTSEAAPKLLDFGIAKVLDSPEGGPGSTLTRDVHPMTPQYASPEQVRGETLTTATDVYSLGVLLFELLTGHGPYTLTTRHAQELADAICEQQPPKPSTILAAVPGMEVQEAKLRRALTGDLDNIVLKALQKEPGRRYSSALDFADDLERYLQGKPVRARPDTVFYRTGKFVRRHKAAVTLASTALTLLVAAFIVTVFEYRIAQRERDRAERRFNDVRQLANTFMFDINDSLEGLPGSTAARQRLVETALKYLDTLNQESKGDRDLERELASSYERVARIQGSAGEANIGNVTGAIENSRKALALRESLAVAKPDDMDAQLEWAGSLGGLAVLLVNTDVKTAVQLQQKALELCETADAKTHSQKSRKAVETAYYFLGSVRIEAGDIEGGLRAFTRNVELQEARSRENANDTVLRSSLALSNKRIGAILGMNGRTSEAFERYRKALDTEETILQEFPISVDARRAVSVTYSDLGWLLQKTGDSKAALESYRKAYEIRQSLVESDTKNMDLKDMLSSTLFRMGAILLDQKNFLEAEKFHRKALSLREAGPQDRSNLRARRAVAESYSALGNIAYDTGRFEDSINHHSKALAIAKDLAARNPANRQFQVDLGQFGLATGEAYLKLASASATRTAAENCLALNQARSLLEDGIARLHALQNKGQLFEHETRNLEYLTRNLGETETALSQLRSSGACEGTVFGAKP